MLSLCSWSCIIIYENCDRENIIWFCKAYLLSALIWLKLGIFKNKVLGYGKKIYQ